MKARRVKVSNGEVGVRDDHGTRRAKVKDNRTCMARS